jgi:hypothetical protein
MSLIHFMKCCVCWVVLVGFEGDALQWIFLRTLVSCTLPHYSNSRLSQRPNAKYFISLLMFSVFVIIPFQSFSILNFC